MYPVHLEDATLIKPKTIVITIAVPLLIAGAYLTFSKKSENLNKDLVKVERGSVAVHIEATGTVKPVNEVKVSPKFTGLVKKLLVKQGDFVREGQIIACMDDSNLLGQIESARGSYLMAQDQYLKLKRGNRPQEIAISRLQERRAQEVVHQAEQHVTRLKAQLDSVSEESQRDNILAARQAYLAKEGAASDQDRLNAETQARVSAARLEAAKRELAAAEAAVGQASMDFAASRQAHEMSRAGSRSEDVAQAAHAVAQARGSLDYLESQRADTIIRAPFAGVVTQKYADAGAIVTPTTSSATTSATSSSIIALAGRLEVVAQVAETDIGKIKQGQDVEIISSAYPENAFHGHVTQIAPAAVVTQNVTTFEVHASIDDDEDKKLLSGMNVAARFSAGKQDNVLVIPTLCVISRHGKTGVMVPEGGVPTFKPVKVGTTSEEKTVVLRGLSEGEEVLLGPSKEGEDTTSSRESRKHGSEKPPSGAANSSAGSASHFSGKHHRKSDDSRLKE